MEYLYCPALPLLSFLVPSCGRGVPSRGLDNVLAGCRRCQTRGVCGATAGMLRRRLGPPSPSEPPFADAVQPHPPYTPSVFFSPLCPPSSPPTHPPTTPPQVLVWGASAALFYQFVYLPDAAARDAARRPAVVLDSVADRLGTGGPAARRAAAAETDRQRREADARGAAAEAAAAAAASATAAAAADAGGGRPTRGATTDGAGVAPPPA